MCSKLRVAQNGRYVINPVYSGGGITVAKFEILGPFAGPYLGQIASRRWVGTQNSKHPKSDI